jgi:N-acetylglucosamine-6-sulfatase
MTAVLTGSTAPTIRSAHCVKALSAVLLFYCTHVTQGTPPNILLVLADDLETDYKQDRLALMPNLRRLRESGVSFTEHISADPLCGPSRAALLSGRYPHNNGYRHNLDSASIQAWKAIQNNTLGTWLTHTGYHTAYLGKYVNGLETEVPSGWNWYAGFDGIPGTYSYYSARQFNVTFDTNGTHPTSPVRSISHEGEHQADFLGAQTVAFMQEAVAVGRPFFVHLAPVMIHYGTCEGPYLDVLKYARTDPFWEMALDLGFGCTNASANQKCDMEMSPCVSKRNAHASDGLSNPHTPAWGVQESGGAPPPMRLPPATEYELARQDIGYRNRTGSALDLDDMLGTVLSGLDALGSAVANNTYVIFTSDNGEYALRTAVSGIESRASIPGRFVVTVQRSFPGLHVIPRSYWSQASHHRLLLQATTSTNTASSWARSTRIRPTYACPSTSAAPASRPTRPSRSHRHSSTSLRQ